MFTTLRSSLRRWCCIEMHETDLVLVSAYQIWTNWFLPTQLSHSRVQVVLRLSVDHPLDSQSQSSQFALIGTSLCLIEHAKLCTSPDLQLFTTSIHFLLDELRTSFLSFGEVELLLSLEPMSHLWDSSHLRGIVCCHCVLVVLLDPLLDQEIRPHLFRCHLVSPPKRPQGSSQNLSHNGRHIYIYICIQYIIYYIELYTWNAQPSTYHSHSSGSFSSQPSHSSQSHWISSSVSLALFKAMNLCPEKKSGFA